MDTFLRFLYEFLSQFFNGLKQIVMGIYNGFKSMLAFKQYIKVINRYKGDFGMPEWLLVGLAVFI